MPINKDVKSELKKIHTSVLDFELFPLELGIEFLLEHDLANRRLPITPAIQEIIDSSSVAFTILRNAVLGKNVDISERGALVVIFNQMRGSFTVRLDDVKMAVKTAVPHNKAILVTLNLDKTSDYSHFTQSKLLTTLEEMLVTATSKPEVVSVLPMISSLLDDVRNPLKAKIKQFVAIYTDRKKLVKIIDDAQACLISNYGSYLVIYNKTPERIPEYFPIYILHGNVHAPGYLYNNQELIEKPTSPIVNISKLKTTKSSIVKAQNFGSEPFRLWRAETLSIEIPEDAPTVPGNTIISFNGSELGVDKATFLMAGFPLPLDMVKAKFTATQRKRSKKV